MAFHKTMQSIPCQPMHQIRPVAYIGSIYHWPNFQCWLHIFIVYMCHFDCLHHLDFLLCPCTMSLRVTMFHVGYMYSIGSSATVVDYNITPIICCSHCRGNIHPYPLPRDLHYFSVERKYFLPFYQQA